MVAFKDIEEDEYMKKSSLIGLFTLLFLAYISWLHAPRKTTLNGGERVVSKEGEYSYILPERWIDKGVLGDGVLIVSPEIEDSINANVHIVARTAETKESRDKVVDQILTEYEGITLLDAEEIQTDIRAKATAIYSERTNNLGVVIHRSHYIISHHSGVVVVAGTCAALYKDKYDPIFRGVANSIR